MSKIEIKREDVLAMMEERPECAEALKELFPEIDDPKFKEAEEIPLKKYTPIDHPKFQGVNVKLFNLKKAQIAEHDPNINPNGFPRYGMLQIRGGGVFKEKAFYLEKNGIDWEIVEDDTGQLCLLAIKQN